MRILCILIIFIAPLLSFSEESKIPKCNYNTESLKCHNKKGEGHPGAIIPVKKDGKTHCGKYIGIKTNSREIDFYKMTKDNHFLSDFLPKTHGICYMEYDKEFHKFLKPLQKTFLKKFLKKSKVKVYYQIMENLMDGLVHTQHLDLKMGQFTASRRDQSKEQQRQAVVVAGKMLKHGFLDRLYNTRECGITVNSNKGSLPFAWMRKLANNIFYKESIGDFLRGDDVKEGDYKFSESEVRSCYQKKLLDLKEKLDSPAFSYHHLVGSSILLIHGAKEDTDDTDGEHLALKDQSHEQYGPGPHLEYRVKIIDFAHSKIEKRMKKGKADLKFVESYKRSVDHLLELVQMPSL